MQGLGKERGGRRRTLSLQPEITFKLMDVRYPEIVGALLISFARKKERDCKKKIRDGLLDAYAFLVRYPRSEDIEDERDREIVKTLRRIEEAKQRRETQQHKVVELEKNAEFYGPKHPMPDELRADIDFNRKLLGDEETDVSDFEKEMIQLNEKYDRMVKRREYLLRHGVEPVPCDG